MSMSTLVAFHGKQSLKNKYLRRVRAHRAADQIIKGTYWQNGKGCAVGCTLHSSNHMGYETELGIPVDLAHLEDHIFENLPNKLALEWPIRFLEAARPGADLTNVRNQFMIWMLTDPVHGVIRFANTEQIRSAIQGVAAILRPDATFEEINAAAARAEAAAARAEARAAAAAAGAHWAAAAAGAAAAHWAAARAARAASAEAAEATARAYESFADKLIELMKAA
jgi:hypothetical protein